MSAGLGFEPATTSFQDFGSSGDLLEEDPVYPPKVTVSGTDVRPKEVVLVVLALLVLVLSLCLFFK